MSFPGQESGNDFTENRSGLAWKALPALAYPVLPQDTKYRFFDGLFPEAVAVVVRMDAVNRGLVRFRGGAGGLDVIDVFVVPAGHVHQAVRKAQPVGFPFVLIGVEVPFFPADGPLEDERFAGMGRLQLFDEGK